MWFYVALLLGYIGAIIINWQSIATRTIPTYLALIFVVLGSFAGLYANYSSNESTNEIIKKNDVITKLSLELSAKNDLMYKSQLDLTDKSNELYRLQSVLTDKSEKIASLYKEIAINQYRIASKSEEIANLNKEISNYVSGGDFKCELVVSRPDSSNSFAIEIRNGGKYPTYGVSVTVEDVDQTTENLKMIFNGVNNIPFSDLQKIRYKSYFTKDIGDIQPYTMISIPNFATINSDKMTLNFRMKARNGSNGLKHVRFVKIHGKWKMSEKNYSTEIGSKIISESSDDDFPREGE